MSLSLLSHPLLLLGEGLLLLLVYFTFRFQKLCLAYTAGFLTLILWVSAFALFLPGEELMLLILIPCLEVLVLWKHLTRKPDTKGQMNPDTDSKLDPSHKPGGDQ